jgi:hypothetical protein
LLFDPSLRTVFECCPARDREPAGLFTGLGVLESAPSPGPSPAGGRGEQRLHGRGFFPSPAGGRGWPKAGRGERMRYGLHVFPLSRWRERVAEGRERVSTRATIRPGRKSISARLAGFHPLPRPLSRRRERGANTLRLACLSPLPLAGEGGRRPGEGNKGESVADVANILVNQLPVAERGLHGQVANTPSIARAKVPTPEDCRKTCGLPCRLHRRFSRW